MLFEIFEAQKYKIASAITPERFSNRNYFTKIKLQVLSPLYSIVTRMMLVTIRLY